MNHYAQSIAKWEEPDNEDSWHFHPETSCFTLADGAGGVGLFSKEWANKLTTSIHSLPSKDEVLQKIHQLKIEFYNQQESFLESHQEYFADKYFEEGSAATLIAAEFSTDKNIKVLAYGDSAFFLLHKESQKIETNLKPKHFIDLPILINSKEPITREDALFYEVLDFEAGDHLILASDAIAQYLYLIHVFENKNVEELDLFLSQQSSISDKVRRMQNKQLPSFFETIRKFKNIMETEEGFSQYCRQLQEDGLIDYDDYTLIIVEI